MRPLPLSLLAAKAVHARRRCLPEAQLACADGLPGTDGPQARAEESPLWLCVLCSSARPHAKHHQCSGPAAGHPLHTLGSEHAWCFGVMHGDQPAIHGWRSFMGSSTSYSLEVQHGCKLCLRAHWHWWSRESCRLGPHAGSWRCPRRSRPDSGE